MQPVCRVSVAARIASSQSDDHAHEDCTYNNRTTATKAAKKSRHHYRNAHFFIQHGVAKTAGISGRCEATMALIAKRRMDRVI